jgi:lipopolysaccharide export LptBFGC system permease protein LptF
MVIAGFDIKPYVGTALAIIFIFAGIFSAASLIRNLGQSVTSRDATERGLWSGRWLKPAFALAVCVAAVYIVLFYVL